MRLGFWRAATGALHILGWFGFIEIRWVGEQVMINGEPVAPFFIEAACIFLVSFGALALVGLFWKKMSAWGWVAAIFSSKAHEFGSLYDEIVERRDELVAIFDGKPSKGETYLYVAKLVELEDRLDRLDIHTPKGLPNIHNLQMNKSVVTDWMTCLMLLARDARSRNLARARKDNRRAPNESV